MSDDSIFKEHARYDSVLHFDGIYRKYGGAGLLSTKRHTAINMGIDAKKITAGDILKVVFDPDIMVVIKDITTSALQKGEYWLLMKRIFLSPEFETICKAIDGCEEMRRLDPFNLYALFEFDAMEGEQPLLREIVENIYVNNDVLLSWMARHVIDARSRDWLFKELMSVVFDLMKYMRLQVGADFYMSQWGNIVDVTFGTIGNNNVSPLLKDDIMELVTRLTPDIVALVTNGYVEHTLVELTHIMHRLSSKKNIGKPSYIIYDIIMRATWEMIKDEHILTKEITNKAESAIWFEKFETNMSSVEQVAFVKFAVKAFNWDGVAMTLINDTVKDVCLKLYEVFEKRYEVI